MWWCGFLFCFIFVKGSSILEKIWKLLRKSWTNFYLFFLLGFSSSSRVTCRTSSLALSHSPPLLPFLSLYRISCRKGALDKAPLCLWICQLLLVFSSDFAAHTRGYTYSYTLSFVFRCRQGWLLPLTGLHVSVIIDIHFILLNALYQYFILFPDVNFAMLYHFIIIFIITICLVYTFTSFKRNPFCLHFSGPLL